MRARGAKVTDIVVLVVAADDGVMPQTVEAINHAKAAKVPIIVAINKIDKPDAMPERVRTDPLQYEVPVEVDGRRRDRRRGLRTNKTSRQAAGNDCAAGRTARPEDQSGPADGTVIEAKLDRGRGPVATVLVQRGTLRVGDALVAGAEMGPRSRDDQRSGRDIDDAGPSDPSRCSASTAPPSGDRSPWAKTKSAPAK